MLKPETRAKVIELKSRLHRAEDRELIDSLVNAVEQFHKENERLKQRNLEDSWRNSPDRSGGQFSDSEILDSYRNRW
jgi:hypothetical protein